MKVKIEGQFLENGSFKRKDGTECYYSTVLVGANAQQVNGVQMPPTVKYLDKVNMTVDIRAYNGMLICDYIEEKS